MTDRKAPTRSDLGPWWGSVAVAFAKRLRQPHDVDGDPPGAVVIIDRKCAGGPDVQQEPT
jgi:hypothetical protein